jgi:aminoglycoside 6'-N-acetyltransferase
VEPADPQGTEALHGIRVTLRTLDPKDAEALRSIRAEPEVARWWGPTEEDFPFGDEPGAHRYTIFLDQQPIGMIQYAEESDPDARWADIDIFIGSSFQGQGLGTDAMQTLVHHLQDALGHHRLTLTTSPDNHRAIRTYEKIGFRQVGTLALSVRDPVTGKWVDELLMELVIHPST